MWLMTPLLWMSFAGYGYWIATVKRRSPGEGAALGLLLGPIGCIVEAALMERSVEQVEQERLRRQEDAHSRREAEEIRRAAQRNETSRRRHAAQARSDAARVRRAEAVARFYAWFDRAVLRFGWYEALPEVAQPIVIGLLIALPLAIVMVLVFGGR